MLVSVKVRLCLIILFCLAAENHMRSWGMPLRTPRGVVTIDGSGAAESQGMPEECSAQVAVVYTGVSSWQWKVALPFIPASVLRLIYHTDMPADVQRYLIQEFKRLGPSTNRKVIAMKINTIWRKEKYNASTKTGVIVFTVQRLDIERARNSSPGETAVYHDVPAAQVLSAIRTVSAHTMKKSLRLLGIPSVLPSFYTIVEYNRQLRGVESVGPVDDEDYVADCEEHGPRQTETSSPHGDANMLTTATQRGTVTTKQSGTVAASSAIPLLTSITHSASMPSSTRPVTFQKAQAAKKSSSTLGNLEIGLIVALLIICAMVTVLLGLLLFHRRKEGEVK